MEIRLYGSASSQADSRTVEGYALKFNQESQDLGFFETLAPGCITEDTIKRSDIYAKLNHRDDVILARSRYGEGSLELELREDGLYYRFEAPSTVYGDELLEHLRRGEITSSSFAFSIPQDGESEKWTRDLDNTLHRRILKIDRLYDVSPVFEPAYLSTTCSKRGDKVDENIRELIKEIDAELDKELEFFKDEK